MCFLGQIMVIDYKLPYPSGTATAVLINGFHTTKGNKMAKYACFPEIKNDNQSMHCWKHLTYPPVFKLFQETGPRIHEVLFVEFSVEFLPVVLLW